MASPTPSAPRLPCSERCGVRGSRRRGRTSGEQGPLLSVSLRGLLRRGYGIRNGLPGTGGKRGARRRHPTRRGESRRQRRLASISSSLSPRAQGSNGPAPGAHASRGEQGRARAAAAAPCSLHSHRRQKRDAAWRADRAGSASCRLRSGRQRARRPGPPSLRRPRRRGGPRLHSHSSSPRLGRPLPVLAPQLVWPSGTRPLPSPLPAHGRSEANAHGWPDFAAPRPRSVRRGRCRPWSVRRHRSRLPAACPAPRLLARGRPGGDRRS